MSRLVLDASMALAWLFDRPSQVEKDLAGTALSLLSESETLVPSLWHVEISNALLVGERRRVITEAQSADYLHRLENLPIGTDYVVSLESRRYSVMSLAREYQLTTYDATYLDLALRMSAVLATFDRKLANAMIEAGGQVLGR